MECDQKIARLTKANGNNKYSNDMKKKIEAILDEGRCNGLPTHIVAEQLLDLFSVSDSLPLTFEQCLREEFLINTQNYPKEYHNLFNQKFNRARKRFEEQ